MGTGEVEGLAGALRRTSLDCERLADQSAASDPRAAELLIATLRLQKLEKDYRLYGYIGVLPQFEAQMKSLLANLSRGDLLGEGAARFRAALVSYDHAFGEWRAGRQKVEMLKAKLDTATDRIVSSASDIKDVARKRQEAALVATVMTTRDAAFVIASCLLGGPLILVAFGFACGRSLIVPLRDLTGVTQRLAAGEPVADIPHANANNEIGSLARALAMARENARERDRLARMNELEAERRDDRAERVGLLVGMFDRAASDQIGIVGDASRRLQEASELVGARSLDVVAQSQQADEAVEVAMTNLSIASRAVEELAAATSEIAANAGDSQRIVDAAVGQSERTAGVIEALASRAKEIGLVVDLHPVSRQPNEPAGPQRHDRGGAGRGGGTGASRSSPPRSRPWPTRRRARPNGSPGTSRLCNRPLSELPRTSSSHPQRCTRSRNRREPSRPLSSSSARPPPRSPSACRRRYSAPPRVLRR